MRRPLAASGLEARCETEVITGTPLAHEVMPFRDTPRRQPPNKSDVARGNMETAAGACLVLAGSGSTDISFEARRGREPQVPQTRLLQVRAVQVPLYNRFFDRGDNLDSFAFVAVSPSSKAAILLDLVGCCFLFLTASFASITCGVYSVFRTPQL